MGGEETSTMTRRTASPLPSPLSRPSRRAAARGFARALALSAAVLVAGCDGDDIFYDDDPVASGFWQDEIVDDAGPGGHVELEFDGVFEPGDYSDDQIEIEVFLDSGRDAISFQLDDRAGWTHEERLGTLTFRAEYRRSADRMTVDARLDALGDAPHEMEASVRYRVRYFNSSRSRFDREYVWRETIDF